MVVRRLVRLLSVARATASLEVEGGVTAHSPSPCADPIACVSLSTWSHSEARGRSCDSKWSAQDGRDADQAGGSGGHPSGGHPQGDTPRMEGLPLA